MSGFQLIVFEGLNGLVWGLILAVIALGLCLIFGLMKVINIAHGSLYMLGAVISVSCIQVFGLNFWIGLAIAPIAIALLCIAINRTLIVRIINKDSTIGLLATAGLMLIIDNTVLATFGGSAHSIVPPVSGVTNIFGIYYPTFRIIAAIIAIAVLVAVWAFLRFSRYGLWMRAVPQAPELAAATGVPIARVNELTMIMVGITAGFAGALALPISGAYFQMGLTVLATVFIVVVVGGLDNLFGVVFVAIILGVARGLFAVAMEPSWAEVASFAILLPVLYFRPDGLFGGS